MLMLRGADMVFSYVVNTISADRLFSDMSIYFPILLKGRMVEEGTSGRRDGLPLRNGASSP